jgi:CRP-like cAMP-binding protein
MRPRAAPPPIPTKPSRPGAPAATSALAASKRPITLDRLSLPPLATEPGGPESIPVLSMPPGELEAEPSLPPPAAAPPPAAMRPPVPARAPPAAAPRESARESTRESAPRPAPKQPAITADPDDNLPLWADHSPLGHLPAFPPMEAPRAGRRAPTMQGRVPYEPPSEEAELFSRALEAALELARAPDAAPNETRFSNAPPNPRAALTPAEVSPRNEAAVDASLDAVPKSAGQLSDLPLFPLFSEVPQEVLAEMITGTELIELGDGAHVIRQGDPGDALYGIVEGRVAVIVPNQAAELTLAEGDVFGESCLLQDEPRHADVIVRGRLTALRIPRDVVLEMLLHHPPLAEVLLDLLARRLLGNLLQTSPLFAEFDAEGRSELSRLFEVRRAAEGTKLAIAGKRMDGLYISLTGTLLVEAPGQEAYLAPPGSMFGQQALVSQALAPASVSAYVALVVLRLPSSAFTDLATQYPTVLERLAELSTGDVVSVTL